MVRMINMDNNKAYKECGDNHLLVYNEVVRDGINVEYRSVGLCSLCGSVVELFDGSAQTVIRYTIPCLIGSMKDLSMTSSRTPNCGNVNS